MQANRKFPGFLRLALASAFLGCVFFSGSGLKAQAIYAGKGPGTYITVGATASGYESDYGKTLLGGATIYADANLYRRIGVEAEGRFLRYRSPNDLRETMYLVGPKISSNARSIRPYGKFLVGRGEFNFPFNYATGSYFVMAPGAGLDWRVGHSRWMVRVVDFEYQLWPQFSYGALHPYGASSGISFRVF